MTEPDIAQQQSIIKLKSDKDFDVFMSWIKLSLSDCMHQSIHIKDETVLRFYQGRSQQLLDIINNVENASTKLQQMKQAKQVARISQSPGEYQKLF